MKQKNKKTAGFSLIEVLFAMLFLTIIIFGVLKLQTSHLALTNTQQNTLKAQFYASQAMEIAQAIGPESFKTCEKNCHLVLKGEDYSIAKGAETLDEGLFERHFELTDELTGAYLITSRVVWTDSTGEHQVSTKRIIF